MAQIASQAAVYANGLTTQIHVSYQRMELDLYVGFTALRGYIQSLSTQKQLYFTLLLHTGTGYTDTTTNTQCTNSFLSRYSTITRSMI
jgi:hypothetical protein